MENAPSKLLRLLKQLREAGEHTGSIITGEQEEDSMEESEEEMPLTLDEICTKIIELAQATDLEENPFIWGDVRAVDLMRLAIALQMEKNVEDWPTIKGETQ